MDLIDMTVLFVFLSALVATGVIALVVIGMQGRYRERHPGAADLLARTARALNGDATPPRSFQRLLH
ncbi:hypothetical protein [Naumannella cuiyingiana]|uniref:Thiosulfate reductase cytochrome b subunit n=1 Tax=Naumannella cuiyingiana TaxID=1347891 RepID=A0A7Z0DBM0_9ACTN|nr:hypothetical protein [Naumannella cuiyingiana]NYI72315.1 thiosulfate reductase cytochrome b subunit [Naumannella cuiyingiana]